MWFTGRSSGGDYGIGYATSPDGVGWAKYPANPVLVNGGLGEWDSQIARSPSVVNDGGTYHMFYSGTDNWPYFHIGHATSMDGISWTKDAANPVLSPTPGAWDAHEVYGPAVAMNGSDFEMFYGGNCGGAWMTGHASSADGTTWTKDANAIISQTGSGWDAGDSTDYPAAILDGTTWKVFYSGAGAGGYQIGLATLLDQPQLTFNPLGAEFGVGDSYDVYVDLTAATDLYGYQFEVNYDPAKVSAVGAFDDSFFDTAPPASIPPDWDADCAAGVCKFAVSKVDPGSPVSGSGPLVKITFTGLAAGLVPITFSSDILADVDGNALTHTANTGWLNVYDTANVSGVVSLQGRATPIDAGTVTLYDIYGYVMPTTVPFSAVDGTWSANVPVGAGGTTYGIDAEHLLYLGNQMTTPSKLNPGDTYVAPNTRLLGGDANNNGKIEVNDLTCIGGDFGNSPPTSSCGGAGSPDINADNAVNILDLVLAGGNYDLATFQPW
jgi:hypothetical protein